MVYKYKINGIDIIRKVNVVVEIIRQYIVKNPTIQYEDLKSKFPDILGSSSTGVLKDEKDLKKWEKDGRKSTRNDRFKTDDNDTLILGDEKIYVSSQWGDSGEEGTFTKFLRYAKKDLGFQIEDMTDYDKGKKETKPNIGNNEMNIKNIILYGSPGVGKTHSHKKLIALIEGNEFKENKIFDFIINNKNDEIKDDSIEELFRKVKLELRMKFITFHQSFGYEDFIEGFRPNENGDIKLQDGIFNIICADANNDKEKNYYLVIDEINRGNISKIFGELITLIEEDKRDTLEVTLPYSKKPFKIPSNLYIIGTMNSTDKSIALIDIALRRRFTFLKMEPKSDLVQNEKAKKIMENLNNKLIDMKMDDYLLGHSYFMKIESDDDLDFVLEYKIKPLLEEYFYGDVNGYDQVIKIIDDNEIH